jgi:alpha-tubulin suppressor-like RCC1 family protein
VSFLVPTVTGNNGGLANVAQMSAGATGGCAILKDGTVPCWGTALPSQSSMPTVVRGLPSATAVSFAGAGAAYACALAAGSVWCWGDNSHGQLGIGSGASSREPVTTLSNAGGVLSLSTAPIAACAVAGDGGVYCWGNNLYGQLGPFGPSGGGGAPLNVPTITAAKSVVLGLNHTCVLRVDGTVRCWGTNTYGQLGDGNTTNTVTPYQLPLTGVLEIAASQFTTCARTASSVYCWGGNQVGEVGDGTGVNSLVPVAIPSLAGAVSLRGGATARHFCAKLASGAISCWGQNADGQLGNGTTADAFSPVPVQMQ